MKKTVYQVLALVFCIALFLCLSASAYAGDTASGSWGNLTWTLDENGLLTISGNGPMNNFTSSYTLAWRAYKGSIKSVEIMSGVTSIGSSAFHGCSGLTSVTIPESVTYIGTSAFHGCSGLTSVTIPEGVTTIGFSAFFNCRGLTSVTIPESVTSIGIEAFSSCSRLTSVTIPAGVTSIGDYVFSGCSGLTSVTIPKSVTSIGYGAFSSCSRLTSITVDNQNETYCDIEGVLFNRNKTEILSFPAGRTGGYSIPESVTSIGSSAFHGCSGLTSVTIPESVTYIGTSAFHGCSGLTSVTIPAGVTSIGAAVFYGCYSLHEAYYSGTREQWESVSISVYNENLTNCIVCLGTSASGSYGTLNWNLTQGVLQITGSGAMQDFALNDKRAWRAYKDDISNAIIDEGITRICNYALSCCSSLTSVTIPESVTSIGDKAFWDCNGLTTVKIPSSVASIGDRAFWNCSGLTNVTILSGVASIGDYAFSGCRGLTSVTIPSSVTSIGGRAFQGCSGLTSITVDDKNEMYYDIQGVLFNSNGTEIISFPAGRTGDYSIPESVTSIGNATFENCTGLTSVTIPSSVTSIDCYAFRNCSSLTSVTILSGVTSISYSAFRNCCVLKSVTIPSSVTSIGKEAFYGCNELTDVFYCGSEKQWQAISIGSYNEPLIAAAIHYNYAADLILPASLTAIDSEAFAGGTFSSVYIPASVTSIAPDAFGDRQGLTIFGAPGSYAETYAAAHGFTFILTA